MRRSVDRCQQLARRSANALFTTGLCTTAQWRLSAGTLEMACTASFSYVTPGIPFVFLPHDSLAFVNHKAYSFLFRWLKVEPENGLPPVDKEFYVMQGEFYTEEADASSNVLPPSYERPVAVYSVAFQQS